MNIKLLLASIIIFPINLSLINYPVIANIVNVPFKNSDIIKQDTVKNNISSNHNHLVARNNLTEKVKFKRGDGTEAFSLKPKHNGIKIEAADNREIARLTVDNNRKIKIKNPADITLGYVVSKSNSWKIKNANQTKILFILRKQADGDYKLETSQDKAIYRIKRRNYGFEIEKPNKQSLYKIKTKNNKIVLQDGNDKIVIQTSSKFSLAAMTCLGFDVLSQEQKIALAYALSLAGQ